MESRMWLFYVALAGLAWGTYVPLIFYGGSELGGKSPMGGRFLAILCVGVAYFVLAVVIPLAMFLSKQTEWPDIKTTGLVFSGLAGVAGAVGAICVIFATKSAVDTAKAAGLNPATYKLYIAPLIFGLAPVINTIVSMLWHPREGSPFNFGFTMPHMFEVDVNANKTQIRQAVQTLFKVKVAEVRTTTTAGKLRRRGRFAGYRSDWKKAYVKLKPGEKTPEYAEI